MIYFLLAREYMIIRNKDKIKHIFSFFFSRCVHTNDLERCNDIVFNYWVMLLDVTKMKKYFKVKKKKDFLIRSTEKSIPPRKDNQKISEQQTPKESERNPKSPLDSS